MAAAAPATGAAAAAATGGAATGEGSGAQLTSDETALYDRQIRLWGVEAQRRMAASRVLISGMNCLGAEICKNIVLAGMHVTLHDTAATQPQEVGQQFFLTADSVGRAVASAKLVSELNPLVTLQTLTDSIVAAEPDFWRGFALVVLCGADQATELAVGAACRNACVPVIVCGASGFYGYMTADLGAHEYQVTGSTEVQKAVWPSLRDAVNGSWASLKVPGAFFALQAAHLVSGSADDAAIGRAISDAATAHSVAATAFDRDMIRHACECRGVELAAVVAVLGGLVGLEAVKVVSRKDAPICNWLIFDGTTGAAVQFTVGK